MHDKTIRRRRLVLLGLVVGSLLLLTASFGGSSGGGLGAVQRGASTVLTPIQDGASRALKPVRDGVGWIGDTLDAQGENEQLKSELAQLRQERVEVDGLRSENKALRALNDMNDRLQIQDMGLVVARVVARTPNVIDQKMTINQGASDGIRRGQAVLTGAGLVGKIDEVGPNFALVELLTDADFGAGAKVTAKDISGVLTPSSGAPRELELEQTDAGDNVERADQLVTSGTSDPKFPSPFPPNVPVGEVSKVEEPGTENPVIHVRPFVDVREVNLVEVVTQLDPGAV